MYTGSMRGMGPVAFAVWGWIISHQKPVNGRQEFVVELDPELLAFVIGKVQSKEIENQIRIFCEPDAKSRTEAEEGRKLVKTGMYLYRVVNGPVYDQIRRDDERREYNRDRQRVLRAKSKLKEIESAMKNIHARGAIVATGWQAANKEDSAELRRLKTQKLELEKEMAP